MVEPLEPLSVGEKAHVRNLIIIAFVVLVAFLVYGLYNAYTPRVAPSGPRNCTEKALGRQCSACCVQQHLEGGERADGSRTVCECVKSKLK
jgi:hypothetical protein